MAERARESMPDLPHACPRELDRVPALWCGAAGRPPERRRPATRACHRAGAVRLARPDAPAENCDPRSARADPSSSGIRHAAPGSHARQLAPATTRRSGPPAHVIMVAAIVAVALAASGWAAARVVFTSGSSVADAPGTLSAPGRPGESAAAGRRRRGADGLHARGDLRKDHDGSCRGPRRGIKIVAAGTIARSGAVSMRVSDQDTLVLATPGAAKTCVFARDEPTRSQIDFADRAGRRRRAPRPKAPRAGWMLMKACPRCATIAVGASVKCRQCGALLVAPPVSVPVTPSPRFAPATFTPVSAPRVHETRRSARGAPPVVPILIAALVVALVVAAYATIAFRHRLEWDVDGPRRARAGRRVSRAAEPLRRGPYPGGVGAPARGSPSSARRRRPPAARRSTRRRCEAWTRACNGSRASNRRPSRTSCRSRSRRTGSSSRSARRAGTCARSADRLRRPRTASSRSAMCVRAARADPPSAGWTERGPTDGGSRYAPPDGY